MRVTVSASRRKRDQSTHNPGKASLRARADVRTRMQNQKRHLELIRPHQLFRERHEASWRETVD